MKQVLSNELEKELRRTLGLDRDAVFEIYADYKEADYLFKRHFVVGEPFEAALMRKVKLGFMAFDLKKVV